MKKNVKELIKIGILVPAMVVSMVACGSASAQATDTKETTATEDTETEQTTDAADTTASQEAKVYENEGFKLTVPAELADKITVETPAKNDDGVIFDAYETKSVEAAEANGNAHMSAGWLFAITERDEQSAHDMLANDDPGQEPIAKNAEGVFYIYNHPTDVRYERATPEEMEKDQAEWTAACEWAASVRTSFAEENGLTAVTYNGTQIEASLAKVAYGKDVNYTISTLEYGPLEPNGVDPVPYYEKMTNGAKYESIELADADKPDGEYVVLNFPDDRIRYDFFLMEGKENIIRMVTGEEGTEQYEYFFQVTFADGTSKASAIMNEWYQALAEKR